MIQPDYSTTRNLIKEKPACFDSSTEGLTTLLKTPDSEHKIAEGGLRLKGLYKSSSEEKPLITVVTVVYNGAEFLEDTIKSVIEQTYDNVEYIIVDGGSTDGTLDIIRRYEDAIDYWVSEPDRGIYDAMNKGINLMCGSWVVFLNADDYFVSNDVISKIDFKDFEFIYGNIVLKDGCYNKRSGGVVSVLSLAISSICHHQATFVSKKIFDDFGLFECGYKISADYEFAVRVFKNGCSVNYQSIDVSYMRMGGVSDNNYIESLNEKLEVVAKYYPKYVWIFCWLYQYTYERPRNKLRIFLSKLGILKYWRILRD